MSERFGILGLTINQSFANKAWWKRLHWLNSPVAAGSDMLLTYRRPAGSFKKMIGLEARFLDIIKEWSITLQIGHLFPNGISRRRRREWMEENMSSWNSLDKLLILWLFWSGKKKQLRIVVFLLGVMAGWLGCHPGVCSLIMLHFSDKTPSETRSIWKLGLSDFIAQQGSNAVPVKMIVGSKFTLSLESIVTSCKYL